MVKAWSQWQDVLPRAGVVVVLGWRGEGKSALSHWLMERLHRARGMGGCIYGLPSEKRHLVPEWVSLARSLDEIPRGAVVVIDEASFKFHARRAQSREAVTMDKMVSISRQRGQLILFITHSERKLDINLVADADLVVWKRPSLVHVQFARARLRPYVQRAYQAFQALGREDTRAWSYVVNFHNGTNRMLRGGLPSYWSDELSNVWADMMIEGAVG